MLLQQIFTAVCLMERERERKNKKKLLPETIRKRMRKLHSVWFVSHLTKC